MGHGRPQEGCKSRCSPPWNIPPPFFYIWGGLFLFFSPFGVLFATIFSSWGACHNFFPIWGTFFGLARLPLSRKFLRVPRQVWHNIPIIHPSSSDMCNIPSSPLSITHKTVTVAYLIFHFAWGGGSKYFWKSGGICMAQSV